MSGFVSLLFLLIIAVLVSEQRCVLRSRKTLSHVAYVNGIRGKSTVTRLIGAGLRGGGRKAFCKITGTP